MKLFAACFGTGALVAAGAGLAQSEPKPKAQVVERNDKGQAIKVSVDGKIFVIPRLEYASLLETDLVRVNCYPHSLTVETIERYDEVSKRFIPADGGDAD